MRFIGASFGAAVLAIISMSGLSTPASAGAASALTAAPASAETADGGALDKVYWVRRCYPTPFGPRCQRNWVGGPRYGFGGGYGGGGYGGYGGGGYGGGYARRACQTVWRPGPFGPVPVRRCW